MIKLKMRQRGRFSLSQRCHKMRFDSCHSEGPAPKNLISLVLIIILLIPNIVLASPNPSDIMEYKNLNKNITREELATIGVKLSEIEDLVKYHKKKSQFNDVKGWSIPYVNLATQEGIMQGTGKVQFKPKEKVKYIELLTVIMRSMGYKDGVDFQKYPEDYYNKALEIGLADLYIPHNEIITREIAWDTLKRLENISEEETEENSIDENPTAYEDNTQVDIKNIKFSTSIVGSFSGELTGLKDFSGYKVELLSGNGKLFEKKTLGKSGYFSINGFDVDWIAKLDGYKYRVYDSGGNLVIRGNL